jgi:transposase
MPRLQTRGDHPTIRGTSCGLYLYGYLNRIRSSRRLEAEAGRDLELLWLLRKLRPDFKTIADFRKTNREAIKEVCRAFTVLCKRLDLFGGELVAIDGSKFQAVNSKGRNFSDAKLTRLLKEIDAKIDAYLKQLDRQDAVDVTVPTPTREELQEKLRRYQERKPANELCGCLRSAAAQSQSVSRISSNLAGRPKGGRITL